MGNHSYFNLVWHNYGVTKLKNYYTKGSKINFSVCRIQNKRMETIWTT